MADNNERKSRWNTNDTRREKKGLTYSEFLERKMPNMVIHAIQYDLERREIEQIVESLSAEDRGALPQNDSSTTMLGIIQQYKTYLEQDPKKRTAMPEEQLKLMHNYIIGVVPAYLNRDISPYDGLIGIKSPNHTSFLFDPSLYPAEK